MFDLSISKLLVLAVIALVVFGPSELPKITILTITVVMILRFVQAGRPGDLTF